MMATRYLFRFTLIVLWVCLIGASFGAEWRVVFEREKWFFRSVWFVTPREGWVVGYDQAASNGIILHTTDGGESWERVDPGIELDGVLFEVHFPSRYVGWIAGPGGSALRTTDGGRSWEMIDVEGLDLVIDLHFLDSKRGWVLGSKGKGPGSKGRLLYTEDGGKSWEVQWESFELPFISLTFVDEKHGWFSASSAFPKVYRTVDGKSWEGVKLPTEWGVKDLCFIDRMRGWGAGGGELIVSTEDGGKSWKLRHKGWIMPALYAICFANERFGWAGGLDFSGGIILRTDDGGRRWEIDLKTPGMVRDICYTGGSSVIAVGAGMILKYTDPKLGSSISVRPRAMCPATWGDVKGK